MAHSSEILTLPVAGARTGGVRPGAGVTTALLLLAFATALASSRVETARLDESRRDGVREVSVRWLHQAAARAARELAGGGATQLASLGAGRAWVRPAPADAGEAWMGGFDRPATRATPTERLNLPPPVAG